MENFVEKSKNVFRRLNKTWLIRHYLFIFALLFISLYGNRWVSFSEIAFYVISALFYPLAMYVYEELAALFIGNNFVLLPVHWMVIWKVIRMFIVLFLAIPLGTIGFAYLYYKVNK